MWAQTKRQRTIAAILMSLRKAAAQDLPILYEETVEKIMANWGSQRRTAREYLGVLASQGHIQIDTQANRIIVEVHAVVEAPPEEKAESIPAAKGSCPVCSLPWSAHSFDLDAVDGEGRFLAFVPNDTPGEYLCQTRVRLEIA